MKDLKAKRIRFKIGSVWESPALHILLAKENDVVVARCLDFTVSSHAKDEKGALKTLADSIKEYVLTAVENNAIDTIFEPAHSRYWRMYNELETEQSSRSLKISIKKSLTTVSNKLCLAKPDQIHQIDQTNQYVLVSCLLIYRMSHNAVRDTVVR